MKKDGQVNFEFVLITAVVIAFTTIIIGSVLSTPDSVSAVSLVKAGALEEIRKTGYDGYLKGITVEESGADSITMNVDFEPNAPPALANEVRALSGKVSDNTKYETATVTVDSV